MVLDLGESVPARFDGWSITAVAKLLQHGVNTNDSRLTEITVKGDQVFIN